MDWRKLNLTQVKLVMFEMQTDKMFFKFKFFFSVPTLLFFPSMENEAPGPSQNGGRPDWFLTWLWEVFLPASRDPVALQIELFQDAVEKLPDIGEYVKKSLTTTLTNEARINLAKEDDKTKIAKLLKTQTLPADETVSPMPGLG